MDMTLAQHTEASSQDAAETGSELDSNFSPCTPVAFATVADNPETPAVTSPPKPESGEAFLPGNDMISINAHTNKSYTRMSSRLIPRPILATGNYHESGARSLYTTSLFRCNFLFSNDLQ